MCTSILTLSYGILNIIIHVSAQYNDDILVNNTKARYILEGTERSLQDYNLIVLDSSSESVSYPDDGAIPSRYDDESDYDKDDGDVEVLGSFEKGLHTKNILRWVPKRMRNKKKTSAEVERIRKEDDNKHRAITQNAERIAYVESIMKLNYWTTLYLYGEVQRILRDRVIEDDIRIMIRAIERPGYESWRKRILRCYEKAKIEDGRALWANKKTNNLVIHYLHDPINDNVLV